MRKNFLYFAVFSAFQSSIAFAHSPIFSPGPHTIYKGGVETAITFDQSKAGSEKEFELESELAYGITGDWVAGLEIPYINKKEAGQSNDGIGDVTLFTKYRFWLDNQFQKQDSAAILAKVKFDSSSDGGTPSISAGATDAVLGLTYGHESLKYYRWASMRYRYNGENDADLDRGDKILLDIVGGIRLTPPSYYEPDTLWLVELNGEITQKSEQGSTSLTNSGGDELFVSPGVFWTYRNFAVKSGVQIPVYSKLNGKQDQSDYRAKLTFEWHF